MKMAIPSCQQQLFNNLTQYIDTRYPNCVMTVLVDKNKRSLTLIAGQAPLISQCVFVLDERSTGLKDKQFSIDGSFAKQLSKYFAPEQDIELDFQTQPTSMLFVELLHINPQDDETALRRCQCGDVFPDHLTYLKENDQRPTTIMSKAVIEDILEASSQHMPFEFIELDNVQQHIRVQRDGKVVERQLPKNLELPVSMVLTQEAKKQLNDLCIATSDDEIEIAQQGELLTFKTAESTVTCSLAGVEEFQQMQPMALQTLRYVVLDFFTFKAELTHCFNGYGLIRKANYALLSLNGNKAAIAFVTSPYEFVHPITVVQVGGEEESTSALFRFSPRDLLNIKVKDLFEAKCTKLEVIQHSNGELTLGIYTSLESKLPYCSIPIEKDERQLPKVAAMLESLDKKQSTTPLKKQEVQADLFDYDMDELW